MGYKKLDEVMELLTDELDGFNKSIVRLERLTQNTENIKVIPDTTEIERLLREHLNSEKDKNSKLQESVQDISRSRFQKQAWFQEYSCGFIIRFG